MGLHKPLGSRHPSIAPFQVFKTKDAPIVIAAGNDHLFSIMANAISAPELAQDLNFSTNVLRHQNIDELQRQIEHRLAEKSSEEWLEIFDQAGVPSGPINTVKELVNNDQIAARNMIVETIDHDVGSLKIAGNPIKISGVEDPSIVPPPPKLNQHREAILAMLSAAKDSAK
jgi:CoA:oxalate CoA-transferase